MVEEWKDIEGYEGVYQISSIGRVKRLVDGFKVKACHLIHPYINNRGYVCVHLMSNGLRKAYSVHRLVACAFIPNPHNYPEVNHISEVKTDNSISNLEWCTSAYNREYGSGQQRAIVSIRENHHVRSVCQISQDGSIVKVWKTIKSASETLKIDGSQITKCCKGVRKTVGGYRWNYID